MCDGEGKEAKGPGSSLGQETGEDIAGTRVVPTEPCFITRARLRARGDLTEKVDCRRFWGGRSVTLVTGKLTVTGGMLSMAVHIANTNLIEE